ncbi:MAG: hypothetical protein QOI55_1737, partial [Actinomycetota bacterium]|nr:hypothetical protein [Actinomycetota bacterium]
MPLEYRAIAATEFEEFLDVDRMGFGTAPRRPDLPETWARGEL